MLNTLNKTSEAFMIRLLLNCDTISMNDDWLFMNVSSLISLEKRWINFHDVKSKFHKELKLWTKMPLGIVKRY